MMLGAQKGVLHARPGRSKQVLTDLLVTVVIIAIIIVIVITIINLSSSSP